MNKISIYKEIDKRLTGREKLYREKYEAEDEIRRLKGLIDHLNIKIGWENMELDKLYAFLKESDNQEKKNGETI